MPHSTLQANEHQHHPTENYALRDCLFVCVQGAFQPAGCPRCCCPRSSQRSAASPTSSQSSFRHAHGQVLVLVPASCWIHTLLGTPADC